MPIELAGISNENEFYSEHYLTTVFEGDIDETFAAWREAEKSGAVPPNKAVDKAGVLWRRLSPTYRDERNDQKRLLTGRAFAHDFLTALGYERRSELLPDAEVSSSPSSLGAYAPTARTRSGSLRCRRPPARISRLTRS